MIIYAGKDYQDVSRKAANIMSAQIIMKPDAVLGLATGSTPVGNVCTTGRMVQKRGSGFFQGDKCESG